MKNVESDNNKILYETFLDFFKAKWYLLSELASYNSNLVYIVQILNLYYVLMADV